MDTAQRCQSFRTKPAKPVGNPFSQFSLHNQCSCADNLLVPVQDDQYVVSSGAGLHLIEPLFKLLFLDVAHVGQDSEDVEEAIFEIAAVQRADGVAFGKGCGDLGRDEIGREESVRGRGGTIGLCHVVCGRRRIVKQQLIKYGSEKKGREQVDVRAATLVHSAVGEMR